MRCTRNSATIPAAQKAISTWTRPSPLPRSQPGVARARATGSNTPGTTSVPSVPQKETVSKGPCQRRRVPKDSAFGSSGSAPRNRSLLDGEIDHVAVVVGRAEPSRECGRDGDTQHEHRDPDAPACDRRERHAALDPSGEPEGGQHLHDEGEREPLGAQDRNREATRGQDRREDPGAARRQGVLPGAQEPGDDAGRLEAS